MVRNAGTPEKNHAHAVSMPKLRVCKVVIMHGHAGVMLPGGRQRRGGGGWSLLFPLFPSPFFREPLHPFMKDDAP